MTSESAGVYCVSDARPRNQYGGNEVQRDEAEQKTRTTAWIQPVGMKAVFPSLRSIRYTRSQLSPNHVDSCRSDEPDHSSYAFKLAGVGRIKKNVLPPRRTW
jgi:hypothetical protein